MTYYAPPGPRRGPIALLLACELLAVTLLPDSGAGASSAIHTIASTPYWNIRGGTDSVLAHPDELTEASPWLYGLDERGNVVLQQGQARTDGAAQIARLRDAGIEVTPTIANVSDGHWQSALVSRILHDPEAARRHVTDVVALVERERYTGIDIDYEELTGADRDAFSGFVTQLADALHANGKRLSVDVFAKTTDAGYDQRNQAQDYAALGRAADQVRLMAYDYHWQTSAPGPIAPVSWVRSVLEYAVTQIPRAKIVLGIPLYGYDWVGHDGTPVSWLQVYGRSREFQAQVEWDGVSESPHLTYVDGQQVRHELWFENAYSASAKLDLAREFRIGGVFLWMFGPEDDLIWAKLGQHWYLAGRGRRESS
ncbi:peptidoglycan hydrolase [Amycolatopsis acidicola]|uniref:Peptidoglycan hydrolase n=1 Tax=Amycolatopsis acidicola TaxID=2596893 RepID=A0A5N0V4K9_9PSEU|nr:glycosyl hydrolase family 18 protein [Amycolatopsis acidicola]KAA9160915.1 peptidoglycan hydrolase [Amycolatopsis acidicola]